MNDACRRADLAVLCALAVLVVACGCAKQARVDRDDRVTECANNLGQLWKAMHAYSIDYGGRNKMMPPDTGRDFWLKLMTTRRPIAENIDVYDCPLTLLEVEPGVCEYRGPSGNVNSYSASDPVGADLEGNHGIKAGGNVLRQSGDVMNYHPGDKAWIDAFTKTTP